ncbi:MULTISPECIES: hypothetical protein [unclassified Bacillus (in: firmicutes)]|nr:MULTISPECIES: hypothetical protein [unclassified Bacillus (in: firmicutes)]SFB19499.1 hypothetical protein SAMN02799634_1082 [Bacillus sp. UNCCL13]SFQ90680.1 hypothetical protein SAMN04488577_3818 [Bacillus sp. cl95]
MSEMVYFYGRNHEGGRAIAFKGMGIPLRWTRRNGIRIDYEKAAK